MTTYDTTKLLTKILLLLLLLLYDIDVSCYRPFLSGTSLEPAVIPTAQASSFTLQYFIIIIIIIIIVFVVVLGPLLFEIFTNEVCGRFQLKCYGTP